VTEKVTFFPAYGYQDASGWQAPLQAWVHEDAIVPAAVAALAALLGVNGREELRIFHERSRDFLADSESRETVTFCFDNDPSATDHSISNGRTDANGLINGTFALTLSEAAALLTRQGSTDGLLTFRASSRGHVGAGRMQLIPPTGLSVISDIDDTIKETGVPSGAMTVVRNTFFREFEAIAGMAAAYAASGATAFHYVSGSPFQLYAPLADFLTGATFLPGTLHLKLVTKDLLSCRTWEALCKLVLDPDGTYNHKVAEIIDLMRRFPGRRFLLVGDSGEKDPEIYREILRRFPSQVQEIRIRDVVNARVDDPSRLVGMTIIPGPDLR